MEIVRKLAGYSMGRSDLVRRAMSKKKHKVMEEERRNFIYGITDEKGDIEVPGCLRNGISEEAANKIFDQMMDFASYAFNKSHAAAYAVVGFQTAYLMRYYPVEYIAAMLNSVMGINEKVAYYINFAESLGIQVLPPDINESNVRFTVKKDTIRFGLAAIKNVGVNVVESIVKSRNEKGVFKSFMDFCNKIDTSAINKRAVESLIKSGAFDGFKIFRSQLLAVHEKILDGVTSQKKKNIEGQMNLFSGIMEEAEEVDIKYPNIREFEKKHILAMEKEMTGLYLTGHPLDEYAQTLKHQSSVDVAKIIKDYEETFSEEAMIQGELSHLSNRLKDGERVILGGIIAEVSRKITKNNTIMAFAKLEDLTGTVECVIFPKTYEKISSLVEVDQLVVIKGRIAMREDENPKILCEDIYPLEKVNQSKLYIQVDDQKVAREIMNELKPILSNFKGSTAVYLFAAKERIPFRLSREYWIDTESNIVFLLKKKFGEEKVKLVSE